MSPIILVAILTGCTISLLALSVSLLVVRRLQTLIPPDQSREADEVEQDADEPVQKL